jgi:hypothetical protein
MASGEATSRTPGDPQDGSAGHTFAGTAGGTGHRLDRHRVAAAPLLKSDLSPVENSRVLQIDRDPDQGELQSAYAEYRSAMAAWRSSVTAGSSRAEAATERLLRARVALYRALVVAGWQPPAHVAQQLERDAALVETPENFDALLAP